jgi:crotonobetainyl-CoA:carnitine CoA-transferase CaiB-like acyl-CoA transferase
VTAPLPLAGVRVISLAQQYPGPFATMVLADLGADVVLVERPGTGDPARAFPGFFDAMARGKRSAALDLKRDAGRAAMRRLIAGADVLLEGFRPGTMARLGLGPEVLLQDQPGLVYVSVSGFGQTGPHRARPGHDLTYQAEAGMLYEHLPPSPPPPAPAVALGDLSAGMFAVQAVLLGLVGQSRTGRGGYFDVSMADCLTTLLAAHAGPVLNASGPPGFPYEPGYGVFVTSDGAYLALGIVHEDPFWRALCDVTGLDAERDLDASARRADHERLAGLLAAAIARRSAADWEQTLSAADVPYGRVRSLAELPGTAQSRARGLFTSPDGPTGAVDVRQPLVIDGTAPGPARGVPALGEHTVQVLGESGLAADMIAELLASGAAADGGSARVQTVDQ